MNKKIIVSVFLCLFILFSMLLSQEEFKEKKVWEDERIGITLNKFEKTNSYPSEFKSSGYRYPPPKKRKKTLVSDARIKARKWIRPCPFIWCQTRWKRYGLTVYGKRTASIMASAWNSGSQHSQSAWLQPLRYML